MNLPMHEANAFIGRYFDGMPPEIIRSYRSEHKSKEQRRDAEGLPICGRCGEPLTVESDEYFAKCSDCGCLHSLDIETRMFIPIF
jgi:hypothetical protein